MKVLLGCGCSCRAAAHSKLGNYAGAVQDCEQAISIDPNYSKAYGRMGYGAGGDLPPPTTFLQNLKHLFEPVSVPTKPVNCVCVCV